MTKIIRSQSEDVRAFLLRNVGKPHLAALVSQKFLISRQAAHKHIKKLTEEGAIVASGKTNSRVYKLCRRKTEDFFYDMHSGLEEDEVWRRDVRPLLHSLPENVLDMWQWAFTEMFNNALDHSNGQKINVSVERDARVTEIMIRDDGVGIFRKIKEALDLADERQAIFELSKGKLTTDARHHSGQGIFFTSRMVDAFRVLSGDAYYSHDIRKPEDWLLQPENSSTGTTVFMKLDNHTARTAKKVISKYSVKGSFGFNKTVVPVDLARYENDQLISRSQAKRVLARVDQFSQVLFDFAGIEFIGQAFADEIFRVFAMNHPEVELIPMHANSDIRSMIQAAVKESRPGFKGRREELSHVAQHRN